MHPHHPHWWEMSQSSKCYSFFIGNVQRPQSNDKPEMLLLSKGWDSNGAILCFSSTLPNRRYRLHTHPPYHPHIPQKVHSILQIFPYFDRLIIMGYLIFVMCSGWLVSPSLLGAPHLSAIPPIHNSLLHIEPANRGSIRPKAKGAAALPMPRLHNRMRGRGRCDCWVISSTNWSVRMPRQLSSAVIYIVRGYSDPLLHGLRWSIHHIISSMNSLTGMHRGREDGR